MTEHLAPLGFDETSGIAWRAFGAASPLGPFPGLYYWVLRADEADGVAEILLRMAPNVACTPHTHVGQTATLVIEGEHRNLVLRDGAWVLKDVRKPGVLAVSPPGHRHQEQAGPEGAVVHLRMTAVDGVIWHGEPGEDGTIRMVTRVADFAAALANQTDQSQPPPRVASGL